MKTFDLKAFRKSLKLNQTEFGAKIGYTFSAISGVESGRNQLSDEMYSSIKANFPNTDLSLFEADLSIVEEPVSTYNGKTSIWMELFIQKDKELKDCNAKTEDLYKEIIALKDRLAQQQQAKETIKGESPIHK